MPGFADPPIADLEAILEHVLSVGLLVEDSGKLTVGPKARRDADARTTSTSAPSSPRSRSFKVLHCRNELGGGHRRSFKTKDYQVAVLALGGSKWIVTHLDWLRRIAHIQSTDHSGRSQWLGRGQPLSFALCQAIQRVLATGRCPTCHTRRATDSLHDLASLHQLLPEVGTTVTREGGVRLSWFTLAGSISNASVAERVPDLFDSTRSITNFVLLVGPRLIQQEPQSRLYTSCVDPTVPELPNIADANQDLKFHECSTEGLSAAVLHARLTDVVPYRAIVS